MEYKDFYKVYNVIFDMAEKAQAAKYISLMDFKQECDKTGVDMDKDYYGYDAALEMYCGQLRSMGKCFYWVWDNAGYGVHLQTKEEYLAIEEYWDNK